ncbi:MAG: tetratricopeptide repeat protein [Candidatus Thorarchaeota archaeon]|nr:tetratricopeptide repeat protein [Candidatus Thorarchaeota archaeon]MCK5240800.1 tetratricopeptide repeat protein [Candidatus Thorarchaeota archaeon]
MGTIEEELKRASSYKEAGQLDRAKSLLQSLLNQTPDDWRIWNEMGHCFIRSGDYSEAHSAFENAIELEPERTGLWSNKGYTLKEMGDLSGAIDATLRAKTFAKDSQAMKMAHYNLACYLSLSGKTGQALEHLSLACTDDPQIQEWAKEDTDLDPIRKDPRFADTIGKQHF